MRNKNHYEVSIEFKYNPTKYFLIIADDEQHVKEIMHKNYNIDVEGNDVLSYNILKI